MNNVFVQGTDNKYYVEPILFRKNWYVTFATDEPMIYVSRNRKSTANSVLIRMRKILRENGIIADVIKETIEDTTVIFPPKWEGFVKASGTQIILRDQILVRDGPEIYSKLVLMNKPIVDGKYYTFNDYFAADDILTIFKGTPDKKIVKWVTGRDDLKIGTIRMARNEIMRQRPDILNANISAIRLKRHKKFVGAESVSSW